MMESIFSIVWLFIPAVAANMSALIVSNIPVLKFYNQPIDFGKTFRGKRIFGDHKTIRGLVTGAVVGSFVAFIQFIIFSAFSWPNIDTYGVDYGSAWVLLLGASLGFGAILGDMIKSFFKRQIGIAPGKNWIPFDQLDFGLGAIVFSLPFFQLPLYMYVVALVLTLIIHPMVNVISWLLRLQDKPL